jgi:alpha-tubulin suppressor-like RCC1 family protein
MKSFGFLYFSCRLIISLLVLTNFIPVKLFSQLIAGNGANNLIICNDGSVRGSGINNKGNLGTETTTPSSSFVPKLSLQNVKAVFMATGSFFLRSDGTILSSGDNTFGQLGLGKRDTTGCFCIPTPKLISNFTAKSIAPGDRFTAALKSDGTVWSWGNNTYGALGDGESLTTVLSNRYSLDPTQVKGLSGITAISAGAGHTLALKGDGTLMSWGLNNYGQLGNGTSSREGCQCSSLPVSVSGLTNIIAISANSLSSMALKSDGTVWAWGYLYGTTSASPSVMSATPIQVQGLNGINAISAGNTHGMALKKDGTVWTWGDNDLGQLGDSTTIKRTTPAQVANLTGIVSIAANGFNCFALKNDGTLWAWGRNLSFELGEASGNKLRPYKIITGTSTIPVSNIGFLAPLNLSSNILTSPTNSKIARLSWNLLPDAKFYEVEISSSGLLRPLIMLTRSNVGFIDVTSGLSIGTIYSWRVRAAYQFQYGAFSTTHKFTFK